MSWLLGVRGLELRFLRALRTAPESEQACLDAMGAIVGLGKRLVGLRSWWVGAERDGLVKALEPQVKVLWGGEVMAALPELTRHYEEIEMLCTGWVGRAWPEGRLLGKVLVCLSRVRLYAPPDWSVARPGSTELDGAVARALRRRPCMSPKIGVRHDVRDWHESTRLGKLVEDE